MTTTVYRLLDSDGQTVYIGCTRKPQERRATHARDMSHRGGPYFFLPVATFPTWGEGRVLERQLISAERPRLNTHHNPDALARRRAYDASLAPEGWAA